MALIKNPKLESLATEEVGKAGSPLIFVSINYHITAVFFNDMIGAKAYAEAQSDSVPVIIEDHTGIAWENKASRFAQAVSDEL